MSNLTSSLIVILLQCSVVVQSQQLRWPYNLPPHEKYYPEDEELIKRDIEILERLQQQPASTVRKMSGDPGEKFYLQYWTFEDQDSDRLDSTNNLTSTSDLHAPVALHSEDFEGSHAILKRYLRLPGYGFDVFAKRDFMCPTGTQSCSSINRPNSCCPTSSTCQIIQDTGLGDVGCCDASQACAGSLSTCPSGYTSCPNNPGGGCCLPGYACYQQGCVMTSTTVVVVAPPSTSVTTSTATTVVSPSTVTDTTVVVVTNSALPTSSTTSTSASIAVSSVVVTSVVVPVTTTTITSLSTASDSTSTCSSGFRSCPASLGGGCCQTDRACGSNTCPALSSSGSLVAPVRPTTETSSVITSTASSSIIGCPTGFYACSAYYQGGCCQVGRDCAKTSCPASASTTVVNTNGVTAIAPTGTYLSGSTTLLTGSCATGWSSCAASFGGGCCPSGYACGTAACSATASGGQSNLVGKIAPNGSSTISTFSTLMMMFAISLTSLVAMIVL